MSKTVRAKMFVTSKTTYQGSTGTGVKLQPVYGDASPENKAFFEATPSGEITMHIKNQVAADAFELGKAYYVDFTPAE